MFETPAPRGRVVAEPPLDAAPRRQSARDRRARSCSRAGAPPSRARRTRCRGSDTDGTVAGILRFRYSPRVRATAAAAATTSSTTSRTPTRPRRARERRRREDASTRPRPRPTTSSRSSGAMESPSFRGLQARPALPRPLHRAGRAALGDGDPRPHRLHRPDAGRRAATSSTATCGASCTSSRLKSDFVANVSHELKTPLALIRLFAETLELGRVPSEEKAQQYYRVINKESHRLTQLINNILDFSRIEAGRKEYRFAPTDVARVVREVLESYRFQIEQQGFELQVDVEPRTCRDVRRRTRRRWARRSQPRQQRDQVLARDQVRSTSRSAATGRRSVAISVTDRGIGVPRGGAEEDLREVLPRRGQPGARDEGQRPGASSPHLGPRRHVSGSATAGHAVDGARATPGEGRAAFTARVAAPEWRRRRRTTRIGRRVPPLVAARILIVEDEPDMVLGLKDNFEFEGYEVITASDGAAGLERRARPSPTS